MSKPFEFRFHVPFTGTVDDTQGVIRGVSLMTGDLTAEGHDLEVDATTLNQVVKCAKSAPGGKIPVKLNHGSGVENLCGYIDAKSVHLDGIKVRGDWFLLKSHEEYPKLIERAEKMPECFGLSAAFKGRGEILRVGSKSGKKAARCEKLLAVDCVTQPAANPDGLFSAAVDTAGNGMADNTNTNQPGSEPTIADVLKAVNGMNARLDALEGNQKQLQEILNQPDLADLANMTDEELTEAGYDVQAVRSAVETAVANGELTDSDAAGAANAPAAATPAVAGAGAGAGGEGASLSMKKVQEIVQFEIGKVRAAAAAAAEAEATEQALNVIETKFDVIVKQNEDLTTELASKNAEISALKTTLRASGGQLPAAGVEGVTLFTANSAPAGSFEQLVSAKFSELNGKNNITEVKARSQAVQFCIKHHASAYAEYRERGGKIELQSK